MLNIKGRYFALAGTLVATGGLALAAAPVAHASTAQCDAQAVVNGCTSINSEVPGLPDLDVLGGSAVPGNSLIVFTRSNTDKAEDFAVQTVPTGATTTFTGVGPAALPAPGAGQANVRIQYAPKGALSGLCVSTVNPVAGDDTPTQLRKCDTVAGTYNPYQTFLRTDTGNPGDGQFVSYKEYIHGLVLTNPRASGSLGRVGHRVHVITRTPVGVTAQFWGKNAA